MNREVGEELELEQSLRRALESGEFLMYYQPRVDCRTGRIHGVEAFVRWVHPTRGLMSPGYFITAAENTGSIVPMGEWILRTVCEQTVEWQRQGLPPLRMAVNVSAPQLVQTNLAACFMRIAGETGFDPNFLELELNEGLAMQDADTTIRVFREFKRHGIHLSIDNFGTGCSLVSYLKRFQIDSLKIDRSLVEHLCCDPDDQAIVEAIVAMAHTLKLAVVAEGVETEEQLRLLQDLGCDEWQGSYCSRPVPSAELVELLQEQWS